MTLCGLFTTGAEQDRFRVSFSLVGGGSLSPSGTIAKREMSRQWSSEAFNFNTPFTLAPPKKDEHDGDISLQGRSRTLSTDRAELYSLHTSKPGLWALWSGDAPSPSLTAAAAAPSTSYNRSTLGGTATLDNDDLPDLTQFRLDVDKSPRSGDDG